MNFSGPMAEAPNGNEWDKLQPRDKPFKKNTTSTNDDGTPATATPVLGQQHTPLLLKIIHIVVRLIINSLIIIEPGYRDFFKLSRVLRVT
jgi:hypothetical protein